EAIDRRATLGRRSARRCRAPCRRARDVRRSPQAVVPESRRFTRVRARWRAVPIAGILHCATAPRGGGACAWRIAMAAHDPKSDGMGNPIGGAGAGASVADLSPHVAYTDLREWIEEARKLGEIREVKGLSWEKDIGMASEVILHDENAPCVLFTEVPGTLKGSKVLVNFFGGRRQKMTLGFPEHLSKLELSEAFRTHYMAD